jgi:hypothetical protein
MESPEEYLRKRFERPPAWAKVFAVAGVAVGFMLGTKEAGASGALAGVVLGSLIGAALGFVMGCAVWLGFRLAGGLDRPVRRPDLWAVHYWCSRCRWQNGPDDPWTVRDCLHWQDARCPQCQGFLAIRVPNCPQCGENLIRGKKPLAAMRALFRWPRTLKQGLYGHYTCKACGCMFDKWGRTVEPGPPMRVP